jgi:SAM-dependent methyltransferase
MHGAKSYLMDNLQETLRLEIKTDPAAVLKQATWCGLKPGLRILDAGCGPGKVTSILHKMIQPGGKILGVDYSAERIRHAQAHYGRDPDIAFQVYDLRDSLNGLGPFDLIWVRFVLEYNLAESFHIVANLTECLKPGGYLCLLDLDNNCLNQYELPAKMEQLPLKVMTKLMEEYNFDPYSGRKLYAYLYDLGYQNIEVEIMAHNLIYGILKDTDAFNWMKKVEVISAKMNALFDDYPGGRDAFFKDFSDFFSNPRRFAYIPLVLCKGMKPLSS